jgi:hypothetical protein
MSDVALRSEARGYVVAVLGKIDAGDKLYRHFPRVSHALGISTRKVRSLWGREECSVSGKEIDTMRVRVARLAPEKSISELEAYAARLEASAAALEMIDAGLHRGQIDRIRDVARGVRDAVAGKGRKRAGAGRG